MVRNWCVETKGSERILQACLGHSCSLCRVLMFGAIGGSVFRELASNTDCSGRASCCVVCSCGLQSLGLTVPCLPTLTAVMSSVIELWAQRVCGFLWVETARDSWPPHRLVAGEPGPPHATGAPLPLPRGRCQLYPGLCSTVRGVVLACQAAQ